MRTERVKRKLPYQVFKDKLTNYVMTNLDGGKDIQILILNLRDPFEEPEKDKPIHPTDEKLKKRF